MQETLYTTWPVAVPLIYAIGAVLALIAISQERSSQGAVAWAVALVAIPFLAIPFFAVFGGWRFGSYVKKFRRQLAERQFETKWLVDSSRLNERALGSMHVVEQLAKFPFTTGNKAELLVNAESTYAALFKEIDEARKIVLVQFYIINDDDTGKEFGDHLIAAAKRGVRVCLLYDEIGCGRTPTSFFNKLANSGISVSSFGSAKSFGGRFKINFRNHRKIAVIDGQVAFTGGVNIGDEYVGKSRRFRNWRDTHVRFAGPTVKAAQFSFLEDWYWATGEQLNLDWGHGSGLVKGANALLLASGPADENNTFELFVVQAINTARKSVWIATPYFVPDEQVMTALQLAVMRGVEVRLIVPGENDNWLVGLAVQAWVDSAIKYGVSVSQYQNGFMHQKVMLIDEQFSSIGSANIDNRSFCLNFESTLLIADAKFAKDTKRMLEKDFAASRQLEPGFLERKPYLYRLLVRIARLASPLL